MYTKLRPPYVGLLNASLPSMFKKPNHPNCSNALSTDCLVLSKSIKKILEEQHKIENLKINFLDITFHRDDFRRDKVLNPNFNNMENDIEGKKIILIDDVLYTGRSVRSALSALDYYGRPSKIQLLVLIDRRFARHLPIQPDFSGRQVDAIQNEKVFVNLSADDKKNSVYIINETNE